MTNCKLQGEVYHYIISPLLDDMESFDGQSSMCMR